MNINFEAIAKGIQESLNKQIIEEFKEQYQSRSLRALKPYFMTRHDLQRFKDDPHLAYSFGIDKHNIKDIGYVTKLIDETITDLIINGETTKYIQDYIKRNFEKHLIVALEDAMVHHSRKLAFMTIEASKPSK